MDEVDSNEFLLAVGILLVIVVVSCTTAGLVAWITARRPAGCLLGSIVCCLTTYLLLTVVHMGLGAIVLGWAAGGSSGLLLRLLRTDH